MKRPLLNGYKREGIGKNFSHRARASGYIPAVIYDANSNNHVKFVQKDMLSIIKDYGENAMVDLNMDNQIFTALIKDVQRDPVSKSIIHIDLKPMDLTKVSKLKIPIRLIGIEMFNNSNRVVQSLKNEVEIQCKAKDIPKSIDVDISTFRNGGMLKVRDIEVGSEISIIDDPEDTIAVVKDAKGPEVPDVEHKLENKNG